MRWNNWQRPFNWSLTEMATTLVFKRGKTCPERPTQLRINETDKNIRSRSK